MPDQPSGKNIVQIAKCYSCGKRFQTRVQSGAGLCPKCKGEVSFDRKPAPASAAPSAEHESGRSPVAASQQQSSRPGGSYNRHRKSGHRQFSPTNTFKMTVAFVMIGVAFTGVLLLFMLDTNREAARLRTLKDNQGSTIPAPAPGPADPTADPLAPKKDATPGTPEPEADDDLPPEP